MVGAQVTHPSGARRRGEQEPGPRARNTLKSPGQELLETWPRWTGVTRGLPGPLSPTTAPVLQRAQGGLRMRRDCGGPGPRGQPLRPPMWTAPPWGDYSGTEWEWVLEAWVSFLPLPRGSS